MRILTPMRGTTILSKLVAEGRWIVLLGSSAALFVLLGTARGTLFLISYYHETLAAQTFALWLAGMVAETSLPALAAISFWRRARRSRRGWILHLALLPALWVIVWSADWAILYATQEPDMDGPSGWATLPATLILLIIILTYYVSLAAAAVRSSAYRANGS